MTPAHHDTQGAEMQEDDLACLRGCRNAAPYALALWIAFWAVVAWIA